MFLKINESEISQVKTNGYNLDFEHTEGKVISNVYNKDPVPHGVYILAGQKRKITQLHNISVDYIRR